MAVMMMKWAGLTPEQYEQARELVRWDTDPPPGGIFHVVGFDEHEMHITDVWETAEAFQAFANDRLMLGAAELGFAGQPEVEILPVHLTLTPGLTPA